MRAISLFAVMFAAAAFCGPVPGGDFTDVARTPEQVKRGDECDRRHAELRQQHPDAPGALRDSWVAEEKRCAGTGIYEVLRGNDERNAGNTAEAMRIYEDSVKRKLPYYESSFVFLSSLRAERAFKAGKLDAVRTIRDELAKFADARRPDAFAYQQLAAVDMALKDWPAAVDAARKSVAVDRQHAPANRYLVHALHEDRRCAEVLDEIRPAVEANHDLLADQVFMVAAVDCYFETGDFGNGEAALKALLRENPAAAEDPGVVQLQKYLAAKRSSAPATK